MNYKLIDEYDKDHCYQYEKKLQTLDEDKKRLGLTDEDINKLSVNDFEFKYIDSDNKKECKRIEKFIERYEWLGKIHIWSTHRFVAYWNDEIVCAVIMATPNSFSNILGKNNKKLEKLISRGASTSWAPKNTGSWMIMQSINWMVKNTEYRVFTAYSDPEAKELGTIYQACNFYYLGQTSGASKVYLDPKRKHLGWINSRSFTYRSCYVNYAKELGIDFDHDNWYREGTRKIDWKKVPDTIEDKLKSYAKEYRESCRSRKSLPKHKYAYVKGASKKETKRLRKLFKENNKTYEYPKERGK